MRRTARAVKWAARGREWGNDSGPRKGLHGPRAGWRGRRDGKDVCPRIARIDDTWIG